MSRSDSDYQYENSYGHEGGEGQFDEAYRAALEPFWRAQKQEISQASTDISEYKSQQLPLARIKKIMKSDEDVRMISAEAPVLFAKACELFILDLTIRGWVHAEDSRRRTLQRSDIAATIAHWEVLDFLNDVIPLEERKPEGAESGEPSSSGAAAAAAAAGGSGMTADHLGAVPQIPQGMYYGAMPAMGQYQQQHSSVMSPDTSAGGASAGGMGAVPDMAAAAAAGAGEPAVAAVMFEQWASEGQLQAAARHQHQQPQ